MLMACRSLAPLSLAVAAALPFSSLAQSDAKSEIKEEVEVIVVSASGFEQLLKNAPASVSVINQEALQQRFYRDLTDAMTDVPGVVVTGGGDREDISLRGMGSQYTLILVDGQRQSSRETRPNSDGPGVEGAWTPPVAAIERIEVVRGPMSSLYGSDAIGGVINIITKKTPDEWHGEVRVDATSQENSRSGDIYQANFFAAGSLIKDTLGVQIYGQTTHRDEDEIVSGFRGRDADTLKVKLAYTPSDEHEWLLDYGIASQTLDATLGKTVAMLAPGEPCGRRGCPESTTTEYDSESISLTHNGYWSFGSSRSYVKHEEFDNKSREMTVKNVDFQSLWTLPLGESHTSSIGVAYLNEDLTDKTSNRISDLQQVDNDQWSVFAEDEWRIVEPFALTMGLRYDKDGNFGGHVSPRLYGVYTASDAVTVKGGISTGFRAPNLRQSTAAWGQVSRGGNIYGNPDLSPETSINYEVGVYVELAKGISTSATVFYNEFDDKISRVSCPLTQCTDGPNEFGSLPTTYVNVDEAVTQGGEISFSGQLTEKLKLSANYTYTDSEQKTGVYAGSPLNQLPKHLFQTSLNYQYSDELNTWLRFHYRGEESQPVTGPSQSSLVAPSYNLTDLGANYQLNEAIKLGFGIYNLFDEEITEAEYGYFEDGRRYWASLAWSF
ncbi:ligand-gated channel protein [Pseudoalteromonas sp. OF7H-1]|uniref:ligand-gated channel protein n=1 Tax=Pseudoalteromonas sp. OF7H-1 TaxID=2917755 RepID=UPI001EF553E3|nr:ligand-gated channel protein [Pseudoalteromonas sp. OF7H-1]MCG7541549.1 ligand-gated channel protein [Pseudoalteromonas sp. OF7H-1]